ncbi:MAG: zf-HC2 domain-containing protein [Armatimonadota bacterium]
MNCRRVANLISAYVDGELSGAEMLAIRRHLSECAECAEEYESIRLLKQAVSRLRAAVPRKDLAAVIASRLDEARLTPYERLAARAASFVRGKLSPVAAALAASGAALVLMTAGGVENITPQAARSSAAALVARANELAFLRDVNRSAAQTGMSAPLMAASEGPDAGPGIHFVSLTR